MSPSYMHPDYHVNIITHMLSVCCLHRVHREEVFSSNLCLPRVPIIHSQLCNYKHAFTVNKINQPQETDCMDFLHGLQMMTLL